VLANRLRPVLLRLARELRRELDSLGVTSGQLLLLEAIRNDRGITARDLAEREGISAPAVSGHLARLEAAGLIVRVRAADRRRVGLSLTPGGERALKSARTRRTSFLAERLERLDPVERDRIEAALAPLERLLDASAAKA
jgi:DNA-binding MarR family transcriptional regulator